MENTANIRIDAILAQQRQFFHEGKTKSVAYRIASLKKLKSALEKWEKPLADALWTDLHKSYEEAYLTEISLVKG